MERWIGLLIVLGFVLLVIGSAEAVTRARRAANRRFSAAQPRSTVTVIGVRDADLMASFAEAQNCGIRAAWNPYVFLVTFSMEGVTFWTAGRRPRALRTIAVDRVLGVDIGSYTVSPEYSQPSLPRVKVTVSSLHEPSAPPVDIEFGILKPTSGAFQSALDEPALQAMVVKIREALRGGDPVAADAPVAVSFTPRPGTLEPGTTAFRASHVGKLPIKYVMPLVYAVSVPIIFFAIFEGNVALAIGVAVVDIAVLLALMWRETRAVAREEAAGYTTFNGKHLHLEQRHPVSGMVIREAGGTAISKERFRELLGR